jgi:hypothetical protein
LGFFGLKTNHLATLFTAAFSWRSGSEDVSALIFPFNE